MQIVHGKIKFWVAHYIVTVKSCVEQFHALANDRVTKWFGGMVSQQFSWKPRKHWLQNTLMGIFDRKLEFIINFLELRLFHKSIYYSWGEEHLQLNAKVEQDQNQWTYVWLDLDQETLCIEWICWNSSKFVLPLCKISGWVQSSQFTSKLAGAFLTLFIIGIAIVILLEKW